MTGGCENADEPEPAVPGSSRNHSVHPWTQHLPTPLLDPQNKTLRSCWVAMPVQKHRGHFFPISPFPRHVSLEGWTIPPFVESLLGTRHGAVHFIHWIDQYGTERQCSLIPAVFCFLGKQLNAISLSVECRWKWYMSFPHLAIETPPHTQCLPLSLPHLPARRWHSEWP